MLGIILAAGAGSRLGALGRQYSKPTVPVAGRPLIAWVIDALQDAGVSELIVVGHPSDARLADFLAAEHPSAALVPQAERLGIAAAIACALPLLRDELPFVACACDSLYPSNELQVFLESAAKAPAAAHVAALDMGIEATASRSAVRVRHGLVEQIIEKPPPGSADTGLVALPLYVLPSAMRRHLTDTGDGSETYVTTALGCFIDAGGEVHAHEMTERWEVTTADDVQRLEAVLRRVPEDRRRLGGPG